jgi:L-malate glycosyltransferase
VRILYLTRGYSAHDHRFLAKLSQTGSEVGYARLEAASGADDPHPLPDQVRHLGLDSSVRALAWKDYPRSRRRLTEVIAAFSPDVVHAGPVQQGALLAAWAGVRPLVTMSWGSDILRDARGGPGRWAARYVLAHTSAFVCDCQAVRGAAIGLGASADRITVFPWGVDLKQFEPRDGSALRRRLGWQDSFVLLSTRSWERAYGLDVLVQGFLRVAREDERLRLLMLGRGSLDPWIRNRLRVSNLEDRVHFAGMVGLEELADYYRAADVYLSASRSDGSSVSLLEAMACGLPALVSDIAGNREWVAAGENGWTFPDGNADALAEAIRSVRQSGDHLRQMGKRSRAIAEARADWDRNFPLLLDAYRMAMEGGRTG